MIVRALDRGVPEEKLAHALDVDVKVIRQRRHLLAGISLDVAELLKDKPVGHHAFQKLRKMKPIRQLEVAELMVSVNNYAYQLRQGVSAGDRPSLSISTAPERAEARRRASQPNKWRVSSGKWRPSRKTTRSWRLRTATTCWCSSWRLDFWSACWAKPEIERFPPPATRNSWRRSAPSYRATSCTRPDGRRLGRGRRPCTRAPGPFKRRDRRRSRRVRRIKDGGGNGGEPAHSLAGPITTRSAARRRLMAARKTRRAGQSRNRPRRAYRPLRCQGWGWSVRDRLARWGTRARSRPRRIGLRPSRCRDEARAKAIWRTVGQGC